MINDHCLEKYYMNPSRKIKILPLMCTKETQQGINLFTYVCTNNNIHDCHAYAASATIYDKTKQVRILG
jgi:hypothetical protein